MHVFWLLKQPLLIAVEFKVYYPPPFQTLFLRGLDKELKSSANREVILLFDQCLNGWFVPTDPSLWDQTGMCSVTDTVFLKDLDPKHGIDKACFAGMNIMSKHEQLLVCGPDCLYVSLPSPSFTHYPLY